MRNKRVVGVRKLPRDGGRGGVAPPLVCNLEDRFDVVVPLGGENNGSLKNKKHL